MPLSKQDTLHFKGAAILGMVLLHLFCRLGDLPYTPLIWIGEVPLIYYVGLFGDMCVPIFCFCSGYAHYLIKTKQGATYHKRIPGKIIRFLLNYWIVVILFAGVGLIFDRTGKIPGSVSEFIGNMLLVGMSYNGAWWFVTTYLFLLILSPMLYSIVQKTPGLVTVFFSTVLYFASYLLRFNFPITFQNFAGNWIWNQLILLGTSQFSYILGMLAYRYRIPENVRSFFADRTSIIRWGVIFGLPLAAFIGHGIVQSTFVAPFTAMAVMLSLTIAILPGWFSAALSYLGKHSTNIWLTHMFFYLTLFPGLVFKAGYPVLIALYMFVICICVSYVIDFAYNPICKKIG